MKIVHILTCLLRAGAEENTLITCRGQADQGHDVWLVHGNTVDPDMLDAVPANVRRIQVDALGRDLDLRRDAKAFWAMKKVLQDLAPDVVHTHQSKAGFLGRLAANRARVPIIVHGVHILPFLNVSPRKRLFYLALERWAARYTDAFISVSQGIRDANLAAGLGTKESNFVVYSGMDLDRFQNAHPAENAPTGRNIMFVAALEPRKQHMAFFDAFAEVAKRHPDVTLCLLGQGHLEASLRARVEELGLEDRVRFLGFRADVDRWIAASTFCVLPSLREGLPRVVVQYLACGRPVVVSDLPGIHEIVQDGKNGFIVKPEEPKALRTALDRLLSDSALLDKMSKAAKSQDLERWSSKRMEPEIHRIIGSVAAEKRLKFEPNAVRGKEVQASM